MNIIAFINFKGGTGKTTSAINTSSALARLGKRVLLIDADPQANATRCSGFPHTASFKRTFMDAIEKGEPVPCYNVRNVYTITPASTSLARAERLLLDSRNPIQQRIADSILPVAQCFDIVIIDCSPAISSLNNEILLMTDYVIMPSEAEPLALEGLLTLRDYIDSIKKLNPKLEILGILLVRDKNRLLYKDIVLRIQKVLPNLLLSTKIRESIKIPESQAAMKDIFHYAPECNPAFDYSNLAREILEKISNKHHNKDTYGKQEK